MSAPERIDLETARGVLEMGARIGNDGRAEEQLRGAVAIHNLLLEHRFAYLADEVGMGKTYVALGVVALLRHFAPQTRVLFLSPRKNLQRKWQEELVKFVSHNVRTSDLRVRLPDGSPARSLVSCENLLELVQETSLDPDRDFFVRLSSFSLAMGRTAEDLAQMRAKLTLHAPWLRADAFDLRNKEVFKQSFARALCCVMPVFDLVVVDEAHNLKHGFSPRWASSASARNQVLGELLGRGEDPEGEEGPVGPERSKLCRFPGYGPRARRVLFLSATPIEESYQQLWNQLDLFGLGAGYEALNRDDVSEEQKKELAARFLIRRVTSISVAGHALTKNQYRRTWRAGGVETHDEPIALREDRQRLVVALVQKKVSELLAQERFKHSYQIGMLASFESFLETAKLKREEPVFDDAEQTEEELEREGIDVLQLNLLAKSYQDELGAELPHPKMDALVARLSSAWTTGKKALVFVRRVASVKELKRKLDECYDRWLVPHLRASLPGGLQTELDREVARYRRHKAKVEAGAHAELVAPVQLDDDDDDHGGSDTFFAWFFRGGGPRGVLSGAQLQKRFTSGSGELSTFFADNPVMALLEAEPGGVRAALAAKLGYSVDQLTTALCQRAAPYLSGRAAEVPRALRLAAVQAAALELLAEKADGELGARAKVIWEERYRDLRGKAAQKVPPELAQSLELETFFTALRRPPWAALRQRIWPEVVRASVAEPEALRAQVREEWLRAELLSAAARLGHSFLDLYLVAVAELTTLRTRGSVEAGGDDEADAGSGVEGLGDDEDLGDDEEGPPAQAPAELPPRRGGTIHRFLERLAAQARGEGAGWGALAELAELAANFELIWDVNLASPTGRRGHQGEPSLSSLRGHLARVLRQQQPAAGMSGEVNQTLIRQFRMPGYPLVLVTTDLLQEGEDLHTFCSEVHHYGISWTPSAMEQRIGRIDRVRSQTERRLVALDRAPGGDDKLQVTFPHLQDTVEVLQVERVLERMDTFLRLMHEELTTSTAGLRRIDVHRGLVAGPRPADSIEASLKSSFPVRESALRGRRRKPQGVTSLAERVRRLATSSGAARVEWGQPLSELPPRAAASDGEPAPSLRLRAFEGYLVACHATENDDVLLGEQAYDAARVALLARRSTDDGERRLKLRRVAEPSVDWWRLVRGAGLERDREGDGVLVSLAGGRSHQVLVIETKETFELRAVVARAAAAREVAELKLRLGQLNRQLALVKVQFDERCVLVCRGWLPKIGMTAAELGLLIRRVAVESDRLEFLLTGQDRE